VNEVPPWARLIPYLPGVALPIRWRLTLLYALILGSSLLVSDFLVYLTLDRYLAGEIDDSLSSQAQEIVGTTQYQVVGGPVSPGLLVAPPNVNVFSAPGLSVQLLQLSGTTVARSANLGGRDLPVSQSALERARHGEPTYETVQLDRTPVRMLYRPLEINEDVVGVVQVARSLHDAQVTMGRLRVVFVTIGALSLLVASLSGWWLAGAALRPIDRLTRDARTIGESRDFGRRVEDLETQDEVGRLATTFNVMLEELQEAYDELEQTLAAQQRFVADASHELRTPLSTIRTNLELLQRAGDALDDLDRDEAMADAVAEIERLSRLVASLLTLARVDSGLRLERREPVQIHQIVRDVYRQARLMALPHEQKIVLDDVEEAQVSGDPDYLKELLLILVDNAVSYTPNGGEIRLALACDDGEAQIAVTDNGVGIDQADLPHLFERFYRADQTRARSAPPSRGGTGLGLAIARWIVDEHNGQIDVRSQIGRGSTFIIRLPALPVEAESHPVPVGV
jgi:two-component system OmpR family sensor kinase